VQLSLFGFEQHPLLDEVRASDLDNLTPLEALKLIGQWQQQLTDSPSQKPR